MNKLSRKTLRSIDLKNLFYRVSTKLFFFLKRNFNIHISPANYYSPIPNLWQLIPKVSITITAVKTWIGTALYINAIYKIYSPDILKKLSYIKTQALL